MANRPRGREKNVTGQGKNIGRRGSGLGSGPVGAPGRIPSGTGSSSSGSGRNVTRSGGGMKLILIILALVLGGGGGVGSLLFGGEGTSSGGGYEQTAQTQIGTPNLSSMFGNLSGGNTSSGWDLPSNTGKLDTTAKTGTREKYTSVLGENRDKVTLMIYLCGTDLESRSRMATMDIQEMINAEISDNVNVLIYTGGCRKWQNDAISSTTNQIWQVTNDGIVCLEENLGSKSMTDPANLTYFIKWCAQNFPANRNDLIFWDHGGGTVSGFGYDEKFAASGSMTLDKIDDALTKGGVKFDFIGFDACLMATAETALMLTEHADYLIASEETEPGIGWYYTDWLTKLSRPPSMSTHEIGKNIIDGFVDTCARECRGQSATLSLVDLAEIEAVLPKALAEFSQDTYELIKNNNYAQVSDARSGTREFGASSKIDQVDLVHLAKNMGTSEGNALAEALLGAVKYNRTSSNMANSYGISIYFPFRKASMVDDAVDTYENIGLGDEYVKCIQAFASMEVSGQAASGGTASPLPSLMEMLGSMGGIASSLGSSDMIGELLGSFLGGNVGSIAGLTGLNTDFLSGRAMSDSETIEYITANSFDAGQLTWTPTENGDAIVLSEDQWELVQTLHANMFYDDGEGFIDLGMDTLYEFDDYGNLLAPDEITWIAINEQPVAYYHESTVDDGTDYSIVGRVPVLYNGDRAELVLEFTDEDPYGSVVGVRRIYTEGETATAAKTMDTVKDGDVIDFVCDYYSYSGEYLDSYMFGDRLIVDGELVISDVYIDRDQASLTYLFTDIYNQTYWTDPVE